MKLRIAITGCFVGDTDNGSSCSCSCCCCCCKDGDDGDDNDKIVAVVRLSLLSLLLVTVVKGAVIVAVGAPTVVIFASCPRTPSGSISPSYAYIAPESRCRRLLA